MKSSRCQVEMFKKTEVVTTQRPVLGLHRDVWCLEPEHTNALATVHVRDMKA